MRETIKRRNFQRIALSQPVAATIELLTQAFSSEARLPSEPVIYVVDISAGGLKFVSRTRFMVNHLAIYTLTVPLEGNLLLLHGKIIRERKLDEDFFEYGVKLVFD